MDLVSSIVGQFNLSTFSHICSETTEPIELKYGMEAPYVGRQRFVKMVQGHMTKMTATPIY